MLAAIASACALHTAACSDVDVREETEAPRTEITTSFALRNDMRKLWTDHVTWTRVVIIDTLAGLPDTGQATERLLQNQVDIGNAIKPFYGEAAGNQLTQLLKEHITGAAAVLTAAKAGDTDALAKANTAWHANADAIAEFLADANPNWKLADLQMLMNMHLDQTVAEATARLEGDWTGDVTQYDVIVKHILAMADALTDGIAAQFPDKVGADPMAAANQDLHREMRSLWEDHVTWTRVVVISAVAGLPDTDAAVARLMQNQADLGNAIKPFYGDAAGDQLTALLEEHISLAIEVVTAARAPSGGPTELFDDAKARWYKNGDEIAAFLAGANPNWELADLKAMMKAHLDQTLGEASARLTGDWAADVTTYDAIVAHILMMSDALSDGIAAQFPAKVGS